MDEWHGGVGSLVMHFTDWALDRTLKGIGIMDAAPVYEPLPGFAR